MPTLDEEGKQGAGLLPTEAMLGSNGAALDSFGENSRVMVGHGRCFYHLNKDTAAGLEKAIIFKL